MSTSDMWVIIDNLCRCCHAQGTLTNLGESCSDSDEKIYADMINNCFGINLIPVPGILNTVTYSICDECIKCVKDAIKFKTSVLKCEEKFREFCDKNQIEVKQEPSIVLESIVKQEISDTSLDVLDDNSLEDESKDHLADLPDYGSDDHDEKLDEEEYEEKNKKIPPKETKKDRPTLKRVLNRTKKVKKEPIAQDNKVSKNDYRKGAKTRLRLNAPRKNKRLAARRAILNKKNVSSAFISTVPCLRDSQKITHTQESVGSDENLDETQLISVEGQANSEANIKTQDCVPLNDNGFSMESISIASDTSEADSIDENLKNDVSLENDSRDDFNNDIIIDDFLGDESDEKEFEEEEEKQFLIETKKIKIKKSKKNVGRRKKNKKEDDQKDFLGDESDEKEFEEEEEKQFLVETKKIEIKKSKKKVGRRKKNKKEDDQKGITQFRLKKADYTLEGAIYSCAKCDKKYDKIDSLKYHVKTLHYKIVKYKCNYCEKRFQSLGASYTVHKLEEHNIDDRYKCKACEAVFNLKRQFDTHMNAFHMLGERITCDLCDYECFSLKNMYRHKLKHKTSKDHKCKFCKKTFLRKNNLNFHERIHTGDKRKVCSVCGQAFVQKASLNYHMTKYHPEVNY